MHLNQPFCLHVDIKTYKKQARHDFSRQRACFFNYRQRYLYRAHLISSFIVGFLPYMNMPTL